MDPSEEEPLIVDDTANSSKYPGRNGPRPIQGIRKDIILIILFYTDAVMLLPALEYVPILAVANRV